MSANINKNQHFPLFFIFFFIILILTFLDDGYGGILPFYVYVRIVTISIFIFSFIFIYKNVYYDHFSISVLSILCFLLCFSLLSATWSEYPRLVLQRSILIFIPVLGIFHIVHLDDNPRKTFGYFAYMIVLFGFALSIYGILIYVFGSSVNGRLSIEIGSVSLYQRVYGPHNRISSLIGNPNRLAAFLMVSIQLSIYLLIRKPSLRLIISVTIGVQFLALVLTFSNGGIVSTFVGISVLTFLLYMNSEYRLPNNIFTIILLFVPLVLLLTLNIMREISLDNRELIWTTLFSSIKENLIFGVGFGVSNEAILFPAGINATPHNGYITVLAELGLVGLLLFLTIFILVLIHGFKTIISKNSTNLMLIVSISILTSLFVQNIPEASLVRFTFRLVFWTYFLAFVTHPLTGSFDHCRLNGDDVRLQK